MKTCYKYNVFFGVTASLCGGLTEGNSFFLLATQWCNAFPARRYFH